MAEAGAAIKLFIRRFKMENVIREIADGIFGIALWLNEWNTYINCYLLKSGSDITLIDTGVKESSRDLLKILSSTGVDSSKVNTVVATHGHPDHTGNVELFYNAGRFIHTKDLKMIDEYRTGSFKKLEDSYGTLSGLEWRLIGGHTPGSIALYHKNSKVLFIGDAVCFFGAPLPDEELISEAAELRESWFELIASGGLSESLLSKNLNPIDFANSLQRLSEYDIQYLCTGHGVVLKNNISSFIADLSKAIMEHELKQQ